VGREDFLITPPMGKNSFQCPYCGVGCGLITNLGEEKYKELFKDEVIPSQMFVYWRPLKTISS